MTSHSGRNSGNKITSRIVWRVGQQHHQPVDADAQAAGRRHAVPQGADEVVVHLGHRVFFGLAGELRAGTAASCKSGSFSSV